MSKINILKIPFGINFEKTVLVILVEQFSYWVFFNIHNYFKSLFKKKIIILNLETLSISAQELKNSLLISFLGENNIYWLDGSGLDIQEQKKWGSFLENYLGPHKIIFFSLKQKFDNSYISKSSLSLIILSIQDFEQQDLIAISYLFYNTKTDLKIEFVKQKKLSLEDIFRLISYQAILPKQSEDRAHFQNLWLNRLIIPTISLYTLAQYFFARQPVKFFNYWHSIIDLYPIEYWLSFWSDQIWQAVLFIETAKLDLVLAKSQSRKLPFSFVNTDWSDYSKEYLSNAYNALYILDYNAKNQFSSPDLNFWFHKFLNNKF